MRAGALFVHTIAVMRLFMLKKNNDLIFTFSFFFVLSELWFYTSKFMFYSDYYYSFIYYYYYNYYYCTTATEPQWLLHPQAWNMILLLTLHLNNVQHCWRHSYLHVSFEHPVCSMVLHVYTLNKTSKCSAR